jgi:hypothetical protein
MLETMYFLHSKNPKDSEELKASICSQKNSDLKEEKHNMPQ